MRGKSITSGLFVLFFCWLTLAISINVSTAWAAPFGGIALPASLLPGAAISPARAVSITEFPVPTPRSDPSGITLGPDGNLWFTQRHSDQIGRVTPGGIFSEFPLPHHGNHRASPVGITTGPDGNLWFTEYGANQIGRITPNGKTKYFSIPTAQSGTLGITVGPNKKLWFTESLKGNIGWISPT